MGVFKVRARMRNLLNDYLPEKDRRQDVECDLTVDTGAVELALPADIVERLRLKPFDTIRARTADGGGTSTACAGWWSWRCRGEGVRCGPSSCLAVPSRSSGRSRWR